MALRFDRSRVGATRLLALLLILALIVPASASANGAPSDSSVAASDGAHVVAKQQIGPNIVDLTIQSPALGRTGQVRLITPIGWAQRQADQRWPVLYLLHGCCETYQSWTNQTDVEELPELRDVLVVMPEGGLTGWYSDWWNYGAYGPPQWERFHLQEVRPLLELGYGASTHRAIAGFSMGGLGATLYAARHPGMFRAVASYSGYVHPLNEPAAQELIFFGARLFNEDPLALWGDPVAQRAIWEAHDSYFQAKGLRHIPVFLSSGNGTPGPFDAPDAPDNFGLEALIERQNQVLAARLTELGAELTTDFYGPGLHAWPYWERELHRSLPLLLGALSDPDD